MNEKEFKDAENLKLDNFTFYGVKGVRITLIKHKVHAEDKDIGGEFAGHEFVYSSVLDVFLDDGKEGEMNSLAISINTDVLDVDYNLVIEQCLMALHILYPHSTIDEIVTIDGETGDTIGKSTIDEWAEVEGYTSKKPTEKRVLH